MIAAPLILMFVLMFVINETDTIIPGIDVYVYLISIASGLLFLWGLPAKLFNKCLGTIAYIPLSIRPLVFFHHHFWRFMHM